MTEDDIRSYDMAVADIVGHRHSLTDARQADIPGGFDTFELFELAGATVTLAPQPVTAATPPTDAESSS